MPSIIVKHTVQDYTKWKKAFDQHADTRKTYGSKGGKVFRTNGNPNEVTVVLHWDDMQKAKQFTESPELKAAMQDAGVTGPPQIQFLDDEGSFNI